MKPVHLIPLLAVLALAVEPAAAQDDKKASPSPGEISAAAPAADWIDIPADDLLVMTLAPDIKGKPRTVLIQLMPRPFSQGWVSNIRILAKAHYWDDLAIYRVQDNYVTQWGDPADDEKTARKVPDGLKAMAESDYTAELADMPKPLIKPPKLTPDLAGSTAVSLPMTRDPYGLSFIDAGWPLGTDGKKVWPVHCYGMVGVARGQRPDTGDGSTLYTVIGQAPRHLDRNIAVVGRVIEGIEFLSSLPRGPGALGFYEDAAMRVPIVSVRLASDLPAAEQPHVQYLSTESKNFAAYADARANRRDPFFLVPAGGADICNVPVPIRRKP